MRDQVVVITGSTRGFGYAVAQAMLKAGATVVISGRSQVSLGRALKALQRESSNVMGLRCDVRSEAEVYALARQVIDRFGRIDVWVNNAGYSSAAGRILEMRPADALDMFVTNDLGTLYGTRAALHFMQERKEGTLVNLYGAGSFLRPASPTALYGATKAWVTSFTRSLAKEIKGSGIRVVGFSPGMLLTDMLTQPAVIGEAGRTMMKDYGFVLRLLAGSPQRAAQQLVSILETRPDPFIEYRGFRPWTPLIGMIRVGWQNLTGTGSRPRFKLKVMRAYRPRI